jgi:ubiquinone/menaquinone biosynthesis C-methylase UbiE
VLTPRRIESEELLDVEDVPAADRERSLRDLRRINRFLGGIHLYRWIVRRFLPRSILDLGTGTSDLLEAVSGVALRVGLDFKFEHLAYLRELAPRVHRVVGDARHLPFREGAFDLVTSSHFFHHFSPDENETILQESLRVARNVAMTDTERGWIPLWFVQILAALRLVGRVTRLDAPASVRQGYTFNEVRSMAARFRTARTKVVQKFPFRFVLMLTREQ